MNSEETMLLRLTSGQAIPLINLITMRLEYLAAQPPSAAGQVEYQALRSIALQMRNGATEKINAPGRQA